MGAAAPRNVEAGPGREPVLVSACLLGLHTRYDGAARPSEHVWIALADCLHIPVCPEQLGGLSTPRTPACCRGGTGEEVLAGRARVVDEVGRDVTDRFLAGAREVLRIARLTGARRAFLKERSGSCGVSQVYRDGLLVDGMGVCAALLKQEGMEVRGFGG